MYEQYVTYVIPFERLGRRIIRWFICGRMKQTAEIVAPTYKVEESLNRYGNVSNIMLITVKERTREFGIRKALGATPWSILRLIIVESVIITTIFGYIGMLCGVLANEYMDATIGQTQVDTGLFQATMFLNPTVGLDVCFQATMVMIIAGTLAGLIPARKAAKVRPIEALNAK